MRHRGSCRGVCNPLQPAHSPAPSGGLGGPGLDQGAPQDVQESFRDPRKRFRVPFLTPTRLFPVHLGSSESSTSLGSSRVDQGCMPRFFFRGRRQWPQAISYAAPATKIGFWRLLRRYMVFLACNSSPGQIHIRSTKHIRGTKPCHNGTCGTDGSTVFSNSDALFPFKQQGPQPTIPPTEGGMNSFLLTLAAGKVSYFLCSLVLVSASTGQLP